MPCHICLLYKHRYATVSTWIHEPPSVFCGEKSQVTVFITVFLPEAIHRVHVLWANKRY